MGKPRGRNEREQVSQSLSLALLLSMFHQTSN
jgi:hypothetical protein